MSNQSISKTNEWYEFNNTDEKVIEKKKKWKNARKFLDGLDPLFLEEEHEGYPISSSRYLWWSHICIIVK